jgi:hypothetical protein
MAEWTIPKIKPHDPNKPGEPNPPELVHCKIMEIPGGYVFLGPRGIPHSVTSGPLLGAFEFPMFRARLNGNNDDETWYITVEFLDAGGLGKGKWSNIEFHHGMGDDDPDTWVAHAGATAEEGEEKDAAAASASSGS